MPTQGERSGATRARLLSVARRRFGARGYAATSVDELVRRAGVTKGAFYHHFADKPALFRAVFEETERQLVATAAAGAHGADARGRFRTGCLAFLEASLAPDVQRIVLHDAPAVLGWVTVREIGWRYGLALIETGLRQAMRDGRTTRRPTRALAHLLFATLCESAMVVARAPKPRRALALVRREVDGLVTALLRPA